MSRSKIPTSKRNLKAKEEELETLSADGTLHHEDSTSSDVKLPMKKTMKGALGTKRGLKAKEEEDPAILEFILQSLQWLAYSVGVLMLWELMIGCQLSCYILATHALYLLSEWTDWHIFPFAFVLWGHITRWQITEITNYPRYLKDLWKTFADHVCFRVFCICCCCPREGRV